MTAEDFPDRPLRQGSPIPPATITNVAFLLKGAGITCRYNEVKKNVEIIIPGHEGTAENLDEVTMTAIVSLCAQHGMSTGHVGEYVNAIADRYAYNPIAEWIMSKPWDGIDRLPEIYATVIEQPDYPAVLKRILLNKWLRSAAAAALHPGYKGRGVLTFQGAQGIGKTSWVKELVSDEALRARVVKLDHHLNSSNKDSILGAIANWIVEIGELDSSFKKDVARLKGFITSDSDRVRRPYARRESEYRRRTLFIATVNDPNFLVDGTGNSRWWTIAVDALDYDHGIDTQQLFAQMAVEISDGGQQWWLTTEEDGLLADWNARHVVTSMITDSIYAWLELDANRKQNIVTVTPTELLITVGIDRPTNPQAKECGAILRDLFGPPKRINGRDKWRVPLREPVAEDLELKQTAKPRPQTEEDKEIY
jgi:putative DNA primase/helicase